MKNRFFLINLVVGFLLGATWLVKSQITNATELTNTTSQPNGDRKYLEFVRQLLNTPITFYGKVVDEKGNPIPRAEVLYTALDKFWKDGTKYKSVSDDKGLFTLSGIKGGALYVSVEKEDYYVVHQYSAGGFSATMIPTPELTERIRPPYEGGYDRPLPTKENPAVFVLRKKGEAEPLAEIDGRQYDVPKNGEPIEINLLTKQVGRGHLKIECWTEPISHKDHFNWRYRISVPGGGLADRKGEFNFEAPLEGYRLVDEFGMNATDGKWTSNFEKQYFLKLHDGNYARVNIDFHPETGNDWNFISLKSYINPRGSRNLEFDPNKTLKPRY